MLSVLKKKYFNNLMTENEEKQSTETLNEQQQKEDQTVPIDDKNEEKIQEKTVESKNEDESDEKSRISQKSNNSCTPEVKENPFSSLWNKIKKKVIKDDSNIEINNKKDLPISNEPVQEKKRRNSFDKKNAEKIKICPDAGRSSGDIPEVDEPVVPLTYKETEELLKDPKFGNVKELKTFTDLEVSKTIIDKNKGHANIVKSLVSQDKSRFIFDGFDLDLTYITRNIIAMGFPSSSIEGIYRNNMEDVKAFFAKRHPGHYKVYNLCDDKHYANNCFYRQGYFPFKDHEAPPLNLIRPFCVDAKKFLDEDEKNVVAIHCKAGKGRTGTFICCLLLYMKFFETAEESLLYYGLMRVGTAKGVTVPSQIRYIHYFESILKNNIPHPITFKTIIIRKVKMYTIPKIGKKKFTPTFILQNNQKVINYMDINKKKEEYTVTDFELPFIEFPMNLAGIAVCGDVKIQFFNVSLFQKDKLFKLWFNTNFLPANGVYEIKKEAIDKACKDKKCKIYKDEFKIVIEFIFNN